MAPDVSPYLVAASLAGLAGGLALLVRGLAAYRSGARVAGIGSSAIATMAAGEVRVDGVVEPLAVTLVSPLQSAPCVYYRARIAEQSGGGGEERAVLDEERAVGFAVRDTTGRVRVFPRGATWSVPADLDERTGIAGDEPPGLRPNRGAGTAAVLPLDREAQIAALLTVRPAGTGLEDVGGTDGFGGGLFGGSTALGPGGTWGAGGRRRYFEARLEPGDPVTVVGYAIPYGQLPEEAAEGSDPAGLGGLHGTALAESLADPEIAADLAEAQAEGTLLSDPEEAWGNAAIPGFGIGRPVSIPELDPAARPLPLAEPAAARETVETFEIAPETLVVAEGPNIPLVIYAGTPAEATTREQWRFVVGLVGALLAIGSAVLLALALGGSIGS